MNLDLKYYAAVFGRRLPIFLVVFLAIAAAGVWFATILPPKYRAQATLLVEGSQIPDNLAASTVATGGAEMLQVLQQRLMTRNNLIDIARKYQVVPPNERLSPDEIVALMRAQTRIDIDAGGRRGTPQSTFMTVAFTAERAQTSADVVNEFVTRILEENVQMRQSRAGQTLEFFEQEVARLDQELALQSQKIVQFKSQNADALPNDMPFRLSRQAQLEERVSELQRDLATLDEQRRRLNEVYEATGSVAAQAPAQLTPEQRQLQDMRRELSSALAIYTPENPRVRFLEARVRQLEASLVSAEPTADGEAPESQASVVFRLQVAEIDAEKDSLAQQLTMLETEVQKLRDQITRTQPNAIALDTLERDYVNIQGQYNAAAQRLATAATGERIELLSKGERISVVEQATPPNAPTSPDRPKIMTAGAAAGAGLGAGLVFLMEFLNQAIRRPADIQSKLGITPLVTLPYVRTGRELFWKRLFWLAMVGIAVLGVPAVLYAIHTFYLPLDLVFERLSQKLPF